MKRKDYNNYQWYPVTDGTFWIEEYADEFPNCSTIVSTNKSYPFTRTSTYLGWGSMAKQGIWYFMIIEQPK